MTSLKSLMMRMSLSVIPLLLVQIRVAASPEVKLKLSPVVVVG